MNWAQITIIVFMAINLLGAFLLHGMPKTQKHSLPYTVWSTFCEVILLYYAGAWL